jgi:hypothetical protein
MKGKLPTTLELTGLVPAPPQQYGGVRLIPLLRPEARADLRLGLRRHKEPLTAVALDSPVAAAGHKYLAYVPHGLVLSWSEDGSPVTAFGTQLGDAPEAGPAANRRDPRSVRLIHKMVKRESANSLRFLPLHLAMEGFLMLHFGGPDVAWSEYSRQALRHGLDPRSEPVVPGRMLSQLDEALRVFELHEQQCGVLVLVADALASAFVVPNPADYRLLHRTLVEDFFGELILQYSQLYQTVPELDFSLPEPTAPLTGLADLQACLATAQTRWEQSSRLFTQGLVGRKVRAQRVYQAGPFLLSRFCTNLHLDDENHLGEAITRDDGTVEYLKTFRLSAAQTRRAHLLELLQRHRWELGAAAASLGKHRGQLVYQLVGAGLGYLLADPVLQAARRSAT